jgi:hypothetical protein
LLTEFGLSSDDAGDFKVQRRYADCLASVFLLDKGCHGDDIAVLRDLRARDEPGKVVSVLTSDIGVEDLLQVTIREFIFVTDV